MPSIIPFSHSNTLMQIWRIHVYVVSSGELRHAAKLRADCEFVSPPRNDRHCGIFRRERGSSEGTHAAAYDATDILRLIVQRWKVRPD